VQRPFCARAAYRNTHRDTDTHTPSSHTHTHTNAPAPVELPPCFPQRRPVALAAVVPLAVGVGHIAVAARPAPAPAPAAADDIVFVLFFYLCQGFPVLGNTGGKAVGSGGAGG